MVHKSKFNILGFATIQFANIGWALLLPPLLIRELGLSHLNLYIFLNSATVILGQIDLGMGNAAQFIFPKWDHTQDYGKIRCVSLIGTILSVTIPIPIFVLIWAYSTYAQPPILNDFDANYLNLGYALYLAYTILLCTNRKNISIYNINGRTYVYAFSLSISITIQTIVSAIFIILGFHFYSIILTQIATQLSLFLFQSFYLNRLYPVLSQSKTNWEIPFKKLFYRTLDLNGTALSQLIDNQLATLVLASKLPPEGFAAFALTRMFARLPRQLAGSAIKGMIPKLNHAFTSESCNAYSSIFKNTKILSISLVSAPSLILILFGGEFFKIYSSSQISFYFIPTVFLCVAYFFELYINLTQVKQHTEGTTRNLGFYTILTSMAFVAILAALKQTSIHTVSFIFLLKTAIVTPFLFSHGNRRISKIR